MNTNRKINILALVSYNFLPAKMGGQKCISSLYQFLSEKVNLICITTQSNQPQYATYEVRNILSNSVLRYINVMYFFKLYKIIKAEKISHLQIEHPYYGWLAILLKWFAGVKLIVHSHNIEGLRFKSIGKKWWFLLLYYEKWVHRFADYNLFITEEDKCFAIEKFKLNELKCLLVPYGVDWNISPTKIEKETCKEILGKKFGFSSNALIMLYNGTFSYKPNIDGLKFILEKINPVLNKSFGQEYRIIICGKNIPDEILAKAYPNVCIAGFVDDISVFFKASDLFLNPVADGGGIKTKLVEALAYDLFAVSYKNGAIGIPLNVTSGKLVITKEDANVEEFIEAIKAVADKSNKIGPEYFDYFYLGNIVSKLMSFIDK